MNLKDLENKVLNLEKKYSKKPNQVLNYFNELNDVFCEYSDLNNNMDYEFKKVFDEIVSGEDCIGSIMDVDPRELYYWTEDDHGKTVVYSVDYNLLADLSKQVLKCYEKNQEKEFDIC